jgi:hypothetical protein
VEPDEELYDLNIKLMPAAHSALFNACAREGLSESDVTNRALQFYEMAITAKPGRALTVKGSQGLAIDLAVLPVQIPILGGLLTHDIRVVDRAPKFKMRWSWWRRRTAPDGRG